MIDEIRFRDARLWEEVYLDEDRVIKTGPETAVYSGNFSVIATREREGFGVDPDTVVVRCEAEGSWPEHSEQRAFVNGAQWCATMSPHLLLVEAEAEALRRYGEPVSAEAQTDKHRAQRFYELVGNWLDNQEEIPEDEKEPSARWIAGWLNDMLDETNEGLDEWIREEGK